MAVRRAADVAPADAVVADTLAAVEHRQRRRRGVVWKLLASRNLVIGGIILTILVASALLAPWLTAYDPLEQDPRNALQAPSLEHPFGTDNFGRDVYSRVLHGGRIDLKFGFLAVIIPMGLGIVLGSISGYYGRWTDSFLMRVVDIVQAFPFLVLVIFFVAVLGPGLWNMVFAVGLVCLDRLCPPDPRLDHGREEQGVRHRRQGDRR